MEISDRKKNRLKLRGASRVKNAGINENNHTHFQDNNLTVSSSSTTKNSDFSKEKFSDEDNIFITIEDDCSNNNKNEIDNPKYSADQKLLELRGILNNIPFPSCNVWQLPDLPTYKAMGSMKMNGKEQNTKTDNDGLCRRLLENPPLLRLKREYLCRKRTDDNIVMLEENCDSRPVSTFESAKPTTSKRKCCDSLEIESKRLKLNESSDNLCAASSSQETKDAHSGLEDVKCSMCPICSKTFEIRMKQIDIDSHIASCLSEAGDDVTW